MIQSDTLNCGTGAAGTYFDGCKVIPKNITKVFLTSPRLNVDLTNDTFDEDARALFIKQGLIVPLDVLQFGDTPAKNNYQTLTNKVQIYISQGLYMFNLMWEAETCLVTALHQLTKRNWGLMLLDAEGKLFFDNKGKAKLGGFDIADFSIDNETINDGGSKSAMVEAQIQLSPAGTAAFNSKSYLVDETLFSQKGVQDVLIKSAVLTAASFAIDVYSGCDKTTPVLGLTTENFRLRNASTNATIAVVATEVGNGRYSFTGATSGPRIIDLFDSANNVPVTDILSEQFFASNQLSVVLT